MANFLYHDPNWGGLNIYPDGTVEFENRALVEQSVTRGHDFSISFKGVSGASFWYQVWRGSEGFRIKPSALLGGAA